MANPLRQFRKASGLTQEVLAERAGTSIAQISRLERGQRGLSKEWAIRLAPLIGTTWPVLLEVPTHGLAEQASEFTGPASPSVDLDEAFVVIQEAVAAQLTEHHLPNTQADIARVSRAVEREITRLDEMSRFPATLDLRVSEAISTLQRKWNEAKASL